LTGATYNDLVLFLIQILRARHYLTLNISETVQYSYNGVLQDLLNGVIFNELEWPLKVATFFNVK